MSIAASELDKLLDVIATLPRRRILPSTQVRPTRRVLDRVLNALDIVPAQLPEARLQQVRRDIITAQQAGDDLSKLPRRLLRDAIWLIWPIESDGLNRAQLWPAIESLLGISSSILRRLIDVWLLQFSCDDESFRDAGRLIGRYLATPQNDILEDWKEIHKAYNLFDAKRGPKGVALRILEEANADSLASCRLDSPWRATSGYRRAVHSALCELLPTSLSSDHGLDVLERALKFYAPAGLRFDEKGPTGAMADALVAPWIGRSRQPSDRLRTEVLTSLLRHLGDPRVNAKHRWTGASDESRQTVRSWLSKLSLDAFFDVVGKFAGTAGMGHQWNARKAFWSVCLRHNHILDSWLVLGENVVRAVADNRELQSSYGRLADGDANHAVLLMRVGNLIFAEWTYNGKLRAWPLDWKNAPKLFDRRYYRSALTAACIQFPPPLDRPDLVVSGSDGLTHYRGIWQGRVAALLQRKEGIKLRPQEWGN